MKLRLLFLILAAALASGCAAMDATFEVLDTTVEVMEILDPTEPEVVCDGESVGVTVDGMQCVKLSNGTYIWR